jgi:hypothetical protein
MSAHTETNFIVPVIKLLEKRKDGRATFAQFRDYIEKNFRLNDEDWDLLPSLGCPVWHQRLRNLKSNKTLLLKYTNVKNIRGGFQLV